LTAAVARTEPTDLLVVDRGFGVAALQAATATRFLARLPQNGTARRATPPAYTGRGRPPTRGVLVRPLPRTDRGRTIAATPPDAVTTGQEDATEVRAATWRDLVLPAADADAPVFGVIAIHDSRHPAPLLLASSVALSPRAARDLDADRWPVEPVPLAAKQVLGAERAVVSAPETCQRLPEMALVAGAILRYLAATTLAPATGFWDRRPRPTAGRLRRLVGGTSFPDSDPVPARLREKATVTRHLRTGCWGQRRRRTATASSRRARSRIPASPTTTSVSEN
jgi:hypothetical protein